GVFFGRWPSSTQNGVTQQPAHATRHSFTYGRSSSFQSITFQLSWRNCGPSRAWKNCVSSGRLPYQITMYWAKNRYIQKIENAKIILPRSCMRSDVISTSQPGVVARSSTHASAVADTPERKPPQRKYQPKMFENQVGFSAITWSNAISECANAYQRQMIGASTRRRARDARHSCSSPRQFAVQRANIPCARVALCAAPASAGRNEVRTNTSASTAPTPSTTASVK